MVDLSPILIAVVFFILFVVICILWWLRYYEKKLVAQQAQRCPQSYIGRRVAMGVYHIRVPRRTDLTPPPTFGRAMKYSLPVTYIDIEEPPPTYEDYLKAQLPQETKSSVNTSSEKVEEKVRY